MNVWQNSILRLPQLNVGFIFRNYNALKMFKLIQVLSVDFTTTCQCTSVWSGLFNNTLLINVFNENLNAERYHNFQSTKFFYRLHSTDTKYMWYQHDQATPYQRRQVTQWLYTSIIWLWLYTTTSISQING